MRRTPHRLPKVALSGVRRTPHRLPKVALSGVRATPVAGGRPAEVLSLTLLVNLLGELVAPTRCAACDESVSPRALFCVGCASSAVDEEARAGGTRAPFAYGGAIATAITRFKYQDRADLGARLARAMLPSAAMLSVDVVVPVPLHPARLAERGYNQAALLARPIAKALGLPFEPRALARIRETTRQATLDRTHRLVNVVSAFEVRGARGMRAVRGRRVLLVDDVSTTGATVTACAAALNEAGVSAVLPLVLALRR